MPIDFDLDQNHEPYRQDNQDGMNSLELSTPDFNFGLDYLDVKSVKVTNELSNSLDRVFNQLINENEGVF